MANRGRFYGGVVSGFGAGMTMAKRFKSAMDDYRKKQIGEQKFKELSGVKEAAVPAVSPPVVPEVKPPSVSPENPTPEVDSNGLYSKKTWDAAGTPAAGDGSINVANDVGTPADTSAVMPIEPAPVAAEIPVPDMSAMSAPVSV